MKKKMNKYQMIEIIWLDSLASRSGWTKAEDMKLTTLESMTHKTAGYFLKEDKKSVMIIQSYRKSEDVVLGTIEIPKVSILKINKLRHLKKENDKFKKP